MSILSLSSYQTESAGSYLGRTEKFGVGLAKEKRMIQIGKEKNWDLKDSAMVRFCDRAWNNLRADLPDIFRRSGSLTSARHTCVGLELEVFGCHSLIMKRPSECAQGQ